MGNPNYIQILINPSKSLIAIKKKQRKSKSVLKIDYSKDDEVEFYSKPLMEVLSHLMGDVDKSYAYRITSNDIGSEAIIFDTRQAEAIKQQESVERDKLYGNEQCM